MVVTEDMSHFPMSWLKIFACLNTKNIAKEGGGVHYKTTSKGKRRRENSGLFKHPSKAKARLRVSQRRKEEDAESSDGEKYTGKIF
jgi:hypothetical protein